MADHMSKENRRKTMQAIKSESKLENMFSRELWKRGLRFRKNVKSLYGKPDIAIKKYKIAIFIDSCFWHFCPIHGKWPKSNQDYWNAKLERNRKRDIAVNAFYEEKGWTIKRIWEHEIKEDLSGVVNEVIELVDKAKVKHREK